MVRKKEDNYILTGRQAAEIFLILSQARFKCTGKYKTSAQHYWEDFEKVLGLEVKSGTEKSGKLT